MPVFDVTQLRQDIPEEHVIVVDCFVMPEEAPNPTITLSIDDNAREKQKKALKKYSNYKMDVGQDAIVPVEEPEKYCAAVIRACVIDSEGLIEPHNKENLCLALKREPRFVEWLKNKFMRIFSNSDKYRTKTDEDTEED